MANLATVLKSAAVLAIGLALAPAAMAQASRTWVSGVGADENPCSRTAPCKTFAGAISKTADHGMINVLDSAGYGAVTITKNITIDGEGFHAGVLAAGSNGINVSGANLKVILRNLSIEGFNTGLVGVNITSVSSGSIVSVENCRIFGFHAGSGAGVKSVVPSQVLVKNTVISDVETGIHLEPASGTILASLDEVSIHDANDFGVQVASLNNVQVTIKRSSITNNASVGVQVSGPNGNVSITDSTLAFNFGTGVNSAFSGGRIRLSGNVLSNNGTHLGIAAGAFIESDGTNRFNTPPAPAPNATYTNQ